PGQDSLHGAGLVVRGALDPGAGENRADDVETRSLAGTDVQHMQSQPLAGFGSKRLSYHAVVHAVEDSVGRLRSAQPVAVEHVQRGTVDLALARIGLGIELT